MLISEYDCLRSDLPLSTLGLRPHSYEENLESVTNCAIQVATFSGTSILPLPGVASDAAELCAFLDAKRIVAAGTLRQILSAEPLSRIEGKTQNPS
jgi:hypothetical protein